MDNADRLILELIDSGTPRVAAVAAGQLGMSRQAVAARLKRLGAEQVIEAKGKGPGRRYALLPLVSVRKAYGRAGLDEYRVWREDIAPLCADLPGNVVDIWRYGTAEMLNNAVDHSEGTEVVLRV